MTNFLLQTGGGFPDAGLVPSPTRAAPLRLPAPDDTLLVGFNEVSRVGDDSSLRSDARKAENTHPTGDGKGRRSRRLDGTEHHLPTQHPRNHCDRHDDLWRLTDQEIQALNAARPALRTSKT